jgi:hypothetical protein
MSLVHLDWNNALTDLRRVFDAIPKGEEIMRTYDELTVRRILKAVCADDGSPKGAGRTIAFARKYGLSLGHVSRVMLGLDSPNVALCDALGFARVTRYVRLNHNSRARPSDHHQDMHVPREGPKGAGGRGD